MNCSDFSATKSYESFTSLISSAVTSRHEQNSFPSSTCFDQELDVKKMIKGHLKPLTDVTMKKALSRLGHNQNGHIVFTTCSLLNMQLTDINCLYKYSFLQSVVLDDNRLVSLAPLSHFITLVSLSACNNLLDNNVFSALRGSSGCLEHLYLSGNHIDSLKELSNFDYLLTLDVSSNHITEIESKDFSSLKNITSLYLQFNEIKSICSDTFNQCLYLRILSLHHNHLTSVEWVAPIASTLIQLDLEYNKINCIDPLEKLHNVVFLRLAYNSISSMESLGILSKLSSLLDLTTVGNSFNTFENLLRLFTKPQVTTNDLSVAKDSATNNSSEVPQLTTIGITHYPIPSETKEMNHLLLESRSLRKFSQITLPQFSSGVTSMVVDTEKENLEELHHLSIDQQYILHVILMIPQLLRLDNLPITTDDIALATRLLKEGSFTGKFL